MPIDNGIPYSITFDDAHCADSPCVVTDRSLPPKTSANHPNSKMLFAFVDTYDYQYHVVSSPTARKS